MSKKKDFTQLALDVVEKATGGKLNNNDDIIDKENNSKSLSDDNSKKDIDKNKDKMSK